MADKIPGQQKNLRSRILIVVSVMIILIGAGLGYWAFKAQNAGINTGANLSTTPQVESVPGSGEPSREYVRSLQKENLEQAKQAAVTGTAAVPTITRTTLVRSSSETDQCSPEELRKARAAGVKAEELRCRGCDASALRAAGYTAGELMNAGFSAKELRDAGFTAAELREAGFTAAELARAGFSAEELLAAGFSAAELAQAGVATQQLTKAGVTQEALNQAAINTKPSNLPKDCSIEELRKAKANNVSAAEIRKLGCNASALKAAGFSAKELKDAGFSATELRDAGFSAAELKDAGFTAGELRQAGFNASELADAGFSARELRDAGFSADELRRAGLDEAALQAAGFSEGELLRAGFTPEQIFPKPITPAPVAPVTTHTPPAAPAPAETATGLVTLPAVSNPQNDSLAAIEAIQRRQAEQLSAAQRQEAIEQLEAAMASQTGELIGSWSPPAQQQYIEGLKEEEQKTPGAGAASGPGQAAAGSAAGNTGANANSTVKAGSIMFATLDTAIDSDEKSPILATIVEGPLKDAKLIGQFERSNKKVVLSFNRINIPGTSSSIELNAVAIDPETARTALASSVDSHYLLRYGTLFASAFLSGLSEAITESGSTEVVLPLGGAIVENPTTSTSEKALIAAGEVGRQYANVMRANFARPPTVKVEAGSGIGILFMADLKLDKPLPAEKKASP